VVAIALALGASVVWGMGDFLGGLKSRTLPLLGVLVCSQAVGFAAVGAVTLASGRPAPPAHYVATAALSAVFGTAGLAAFYRAIAVGKMSVVAPIAALSAGLPVVVGIAEGDRPSALQAVGMAIALAGAVLASREPGGDEGGPRIAAGALLAAGSAIGFGLFFLAMDSASDGGAVWASFVNRATSVTILVAAALALRPPLRQVRPHLPALAVVGIFDVMANVLFAAATTKGLVSLVSVGSSLYPVTTVLLARAFLREQVHRTQEIGVVAALAGVVLIAAG
jgi:drug/metabolite transporter (DMT)-like permease